VLVLFLHQFQEVDLASAVAGNNAVLASERATMCGSITGERSQNYSYFQIPDLQSLVQGGGNNSLSASVSPAISWSMRSDGFIGSLCLQILVPFSFSSKQAVEGRGLSTSTVPKGQV
jgi:hypothetical protein